MIKLTATSLVHYVSPVLQVSENFQKRELILDDSWEKEGQRYPNFVVIEFSGDKMQQLDWIQPGQRVTVEAYISGREYNGRYFNTIKGQSVTPYQPQTVQGNQYPTAPQPAPGYSQQPAYNQPQQQFPPQQPVPSYPPQSTAQSYGQQPQQYVAGQQPYGQQPNYPGKEDLPFPAPY